MHSNTATTMNSTVYEAFTLGRYIYFIKEVGAIGLPNFTTFKICSPL